MDESFILNQDWKVSLKIYRFKDLVHSQSPSLCNSISNVKTVVKYCVVIQLFLIIKFSFCTSLQGPELKILEPSINFGLLQVGKSESKQMTIINTSQMLVNYNVLDLPGASESDDCMVC